MNRALRTAAGIVVGLVIIVAILGVGFLIWAHQPAIDEAAAPRNSFDKQQIARGAMLASAGYCQECHTTAKGAAYAGGFPVPTPFGTIYGSNITPDPETGIGNWSEAAFARAMHEGVRRDGSYLYPAFPYTHFTKLSDEDVSALYAFLMTRDPVRNDVPAPDLPFPLNIRLVMAGWNALYFDEGRFQPNSSQSDAWNRGAYLAEGIAHCGACHTPRNALGAEEKDGLYAGGEGEGWHAPALNANAPARVPWTEAALHDYLSQGYARDHGIAAGPMRQVVRNLEEVDDADVSALATYVASFTGMPTDGAADAAIAKARDKTYAILTAYGMDEEGPAKDGEAIFAGTCASCHMNGGTQPFVRPVDLALSSAVTGPDARNLVHIILDGIHPRPGERGAIMPGFGNVLDDGEVTELANYVREHFSDEPAWADVAKTVGDIRGKETEQ